MTYFYRIRDAAWRECSQESFIDLLANMEWEPVLFEGWAIAEVHERLKAMGE